MRLYAIADAIERILAQHVDTETGEIADTAIPALDALELDREQVALHIARYIKGEKAEALAVKTEADKLARRAQTHENRARWLAAYLQENVPDGCKYSDATTRLSWRKNPARVVFASHEAESAPEENVDPRFVRKKVEITVDKKAAAEAMKSGEDVKGLRLVQSRRIHID